MLALLDQVALLLSVLCEALPVFAAIAEHRHVIADAVKEAAAAEQQERSGIKRTPYIA